MFLLLGSKRNKIRGMKGKGQEENSFLLLAQRKDETEQPEKRTDGGEKGKAPVRKKEVIHVWGQPLKVC
jgi:hypothetical protein